MDIMEIFYKAVQSQICERFALQQGDIHQTLIFFHMCFGVLGLG